MHANCSIVEGIGIGYLNLFALPSRVRAGLPLPQLPPPELLELDEGPGCFGRVLLRQRLVEGLQHPGPDPHPPSGW